MYSLYLRRAASDFPLWLTRNSILGRLSRWLSPSLCTQPATTIWNAGSTCSQFLRNPPPSLLACAKMLASAKRMTTFGAWETYLNDMRLHLMWILILKVEAYTVNLIGSWKIVRCLQTCLTTFFRSSPKHIVGIMQSSISWAFHIYKFRVCGTLVKIFQLFPFLFLRLQYTS